MISFVVQGQVGPTTIECLKSIRTLFPNGEIVFSTWAGEQVPQLVEEMCDCIVQVKDPGELKAHAHNYKRRIVGINAGLEAASGEKIVQCRSDIFFTSSRFIDFLYVNMPRIPSISSFKERILIGNVNTCNPFGPNGAWTTQSFGYCDWFFAGEADDIRNLFNTSYPEQLETNKNEFGYLLSPEQMLAISAFERNQRFKVDIKHQHDQDNFVKRLCITDLVNNYIVLQNSKIGIVNTKYNWPEDSIGYFQEKDWKKWFKQIFNKDAWI